MDEKINPKEYEGKVLLIEDVDQEIPKFSKWEKKCSFLGCNLSYFPEINSYFCNQWECNFTFPLLAILLFISSFISAILSSNEII